MIKPTLGLGTASGAEGPKGGQNFGSVNNPTYNKVTAKAATMPGKKGCDSWNQAEAALVKSPVPRAQRPDLR